MGLFINDGKTERLKIKIGRLNWIASKGVSVKHVTWLFFWKLVQKDVSQRQKLPNQLFLFLYKQNNDLNTH